MGNKLLRIGLLFASVIAISACYKVDDDIVIENPDTVTHYAKVTLGKDDISKTEVVEGLDYASYKWTDGDEQYLHVYENGVEGTISDIEYSQDYKTATLTVSFNGAANAPYTYKAKYAKTLSSNGEPLIRADQKPKAASFDPAADVMISKASADVTNLGTRADELTFTMGRVVSVNKMTLTGLVAGELVSKVEFTLGSSFLGGYYTGDSYSSSVSKLTAIYETPLAVGSDGKFPVYFTCAPVDGASIESVVVTTDQKVYTKSGSVFSGKSISFAVGTMKRFNMGMSGCGEPIVQPASNTYTLVQSQSGLVSGASYIIVGNDTELVAMAGQNTNNRAKVNVTATDNTITLGDNSGVYTFTISSGDDGYTIQDNSNSYFLYAAGGTSNNYLKSRTPYTDNKSAWNISISSGVASITNVGNTGTDARRVMCYNKAGTIFSCYKSATASSTGYYSLSLYKQGTAAATPKLITPTNLTAENNNGTVHVEWEAVTGADSYTVTCTGQTTKTGLTVCSTDFAGLSAGTYTITVTAISNNHSVKLDSDAASREVTVTTTAAPGSAENPYTASAAIEATNALASNSKPDDEVYVTGIISSIKEYFSSYNSISYYISDDGTTSNQFFIYSGKGLDGANFTSVSDLTVGDVVVVKGYLYNYNGNTPEMYRTSKIISITHPTATATAMVTTVAATSITSSSAQLNGEFSNASGSIYETGFYWGTAQNSLSNQVTTDGTNNTSGTFSCTIGGQTPLSANTTYYFKAYVLEFNETTGQYVERVSNTVLSFTTSSVSQAAWQNYLNDYGMPNVSGIVTGLRQSGTYSDRDDKWYSVNTSNSKRQIAIHTYTTGSPTNSETLNYVVLYDENKYAPVWTYHVMNSYYWPDNNAGRNDSWTDDPAISLTQQGGLNNASTVGYSRGHLVASDYRQTNVKQNKQTFYHSNQAPQWQNSFNSGVWSTLEGRVKTMTPSSQSVMLYVVTGVLYDDSWYTANNKDKTLPSGSLNVPIPSHFYKCIMRCEFSGTTITSAQGIAFIYTNEAHSESYSASTFISSIDAIESLAGFDFFANVPSTLQTTAESNTDASWFTSGSNINSVGGDNWGSF